MKIPAVLAAVLFAVSQLSAQSQPVAPTTETKTTAEKAAADKAAADKAAADKATAAKPGAKAPVKKEEKKEPEPKIPGTTFTRGDGTFLGLEVVGGNFKLSFYNEKKKPVAPDVTRVTARWPNTRGPGDNHTVLNPSGNALVGTKPVLPPFTFNVYLTFLKGEGENAKAVENYVVPFRG